MTFRPGLPLVGAALLLALSAWAERASPVPKAGPAPPADPADDPLPRGAKVRFGVTRPIVRKSPAVALLPPAYTTFLAPTMTGGVRRYHLGTGRPLDKAGVVGPGCVVVSADGKRAAVARAGAVTVVDVAAGTEVLAVEPPEGFVLVGTPGVALSADGKVLAYGGQDAKRKGEVVVVDVEKKEVLAQVKTVQIGPAFPTLSRDGKTLATHGPPPPIPRVGADHAGVAGADDSRRGADGPGVGCGEREGTVQGPRHRNGRQRDGRGVLSRRPARRRLRRGRTGRSVGSEDRPAPADFARGAGEGYGWPSLPTARRSRRSVPTIASSGGRPTASRLA